MSGLESYERGAETEAILMSKLLALGAKVSVPYGIARYDLVVEFPDGTLERVQCKTAWMMETGRLQFECRSGHMNSQGNKKLSYTKDEIDAFLVYSPDLDETYWVPIDDAPKTMMTLTLEQPKSPNGRENMANEYRLEDMF